MGVYYYHHICFTIMTHTKIKIRLNMLFKTRAKSLHTCICLIFVNIYIYKTLQRLKKLIFKLVLCTIICIVNSTDLLNVNGLMVNEYLCNTFSYFKFYD